MKNFKMMVLFALLVLPSSIFSQVFEPEFVGEAYWVKGEGDFVKLGKEFGAYTEGISWKSNSWDALSLELTGPNANLRIPADENIRIIIRGVDNSSDPLSIIKVIKFDAKKKKRSTVLSEDNSGTLMKSRTNVKNQMMFDGKKHGSSSYMISLDALQKGEYGVIISNPNSVDQKRTVVACFGVDE